MTRRPLMIKFPKEKKYLNLQVGRGSGGIVIKEDNNN
jgi:hypothetical protein